MRSCLRPSFSADAWLAAAVAAAWLAHPPVAIWLTGGVILIRLVAFVGSPGWSTLARAGCAALLACSLACFVYVSTSSLGYQLAAFSGDEIWHDISVEIMNNLRSAFPACLLPVSRGASDVGDLQFGYVPWGLLVLTVVGMLRSDWPASAGEPRVRWAAFAPVAVTAFLLILVVPVPGLTHLLWYWMPAGVLSVTSIWPFQRLYLVAVPFILFGAAIVLPRAFGRVRIPRWAAFLAIALGIGWMVYQAKAFISRGLRDRWTMEATRSVYRPSNLDLTLTSYAFIQIPPTFLNGVIDPEFEYRLLRNGSEEVASPYATALATAPVVDRGTIRLGAPSALTLMPGKRYLLKFSFREASLTGHIQIAGPKLFRIYGLPSAGASRAFGMLEGERRAISIWTDSDEPERVEVTFFVSPPDGAAAKAPVLADFTLLEVNPSVLPIWLKGYLPMRLSVDSPETACTVETPQRFLPGYEATVNGEEVPVLSSQDAQVMVPVPKGHSEVELVYRGPRSARVAFWFCAACWAGFLVWRLTGSWVPKRPMGAGAAALGLVRRHPAAAGAAVACAVALGLCAREYARMRSYRAAVGPIEIDFRLPYGKLGMNQPLLATGKPGAGVVVFVNCIDGSHVRLGADVWGQLFQSGPIEVDFYRKQRLVVSDGALYPLDHPAVRALEPAEVEHLRGELRVELNGRTAIRAACNSYETTQAETLVGMTRFGSLTIPKFLGEILGARRLPIPRQMVLPWGRHLHAEVTFPDDRPGLSEPLISVTAAGATRSLYVTYLPGARIRLTSWSSDGSPAVHADVTLDIQRRCSIDLNVGEAGGAPGSLSMQVASDGVPLLGTVPAHPAYRQPVVTSEVNDAGVPGLQERFMGGRMNLSMVTGSGAPGAARDSGPVHMIVSLPGNKFGRGEPLVATGKTGAGDYVYVLYLDSSHVQLALDHWGGHLIKSEPIPVDYGAPHEIWIEMNSLNPPGSQLDGPAVSVMFDGLIALTSAVPAYPSAKGEVAIARNSIHGSNADPEFSGTVDFVERVQPGSVPKPGS
jgi:hypothetical protein